MSMHRYEVITYDPRKRWVVAKTTRDQVDLPDDVTFMEWARTEFPNRDRHQVRELRDYE